jgi:hypothetical protein
MDGRSLPDRRTYNRLMAAKRWGDRAAFTVDRAGDTVELTAWLRRDPPEEEGDDREPVKETPR